MTAPLPLLLLYRQPTSVVVMCFKVIAMSTLGERVAAEREARQMTQTALAKRVTLYGFKISQQGIGQIESRGDTRPKCIVELAAALEVNPEWLKTGKGLKFAGNTRRIEQDPEATAAAMRELSSRGSVAHRDLPLWRSIDGPSGSWLLAPSDEDFVLRPEPLIGARDGFACRVLGRGAEPIYRQGELIFANPLRTVTAGDDCLFLGSAQRGGIHSAIIGRVVAFPDDGWLIDQFGKDDKLISRKEWPTTTLVVAKHNKF
jgi:transcriptional regulator with XRE-family HTH domain